jgi:NhaP-type Na+/H+ or K+/H+ antiporter
MAAEGLFIVGLIIIMGLLSQFVFKRFKVPSSLLLICFGFFLSFFGFADFIRGDNVVLSFLITFSLIYVIFYGALPIRLKAIFSSLKFAFFSAVGNFVLITSLIGVIVHLFGFSWVLSFSVGAIFSLLDASALHSLLNIIKVGDKAEAQIHTESAILDCFVIVGILSLINFSSIGLGDFFGALSSYLFLSVAVGALAAFLWVFILKAVGDYTSAPIATMAVLSILYAFAEYIKSNGVVAVFAFSIVMSNTSSWGKLLSEEQQGKMAMLSSPAKVFFRDLSFLITTFLFVYLGILVDFSQWLFLLVGLAFFLIALAVRSFIVRFNPNKGLKKKDIYFMKAMCAKGLTPIVLLAVINANSAFSNIIIGGIFFSVLITSVLVFLIEKEKFSSVDDLILGSRIFSK